MIDARRLWPGEATWDGPVAVIDLDATEDVPDRIVLPPCPVVGFGDPAHPLAARLDAVVESPVSLETLLTGITAMPHAAAIIAQLLRVLPSLSLEQGLTVESMAYAVLQGSQEHEEWIAERRQSISGGRTPGRVATSLEDGRLVITLDHPDSRNAIDRPMRDGLYEAFTLAAIDPEIVQVSLRANGRTFSMGAELGEFGTTADPATAHSIRCRTLPARAAARCADKLDAHVQGGCVGAGLEIAAYAKRLTAGADAWFQLPELAMGILPGAGGCVSLTRRIGRQRTALLVLSGKRLNARQALAWGLVDEVV